MLANQPTKLNGLKISQKKRIANEFFSHQQHECYFTVLFAVRKEKYQNAKSRNVHTKPFSTTLELLCHTAFTQATTQSTIKPKLKQINDSSEKKRNE